jgi:hypothetical protein
LIGKEPFTDKVQNTSAATLEYQGISAMFRVGDVEKLIRYFREARPDTNST